MTTDPWVSRLRLPAALRALRHRNYRLLFFGQLISISGVWMQATAQGWLVLRLSDSSFWLGMVAAAQSLPVLLLSLPAGALADRLPKRRVLLVTQAVAMVSSLVLALLTLTGLIQVWHVLVLALAVGCSSSFENPARQSFTIELVGRGDLLNAIALDSMMVNGARVIGPALAGILVAQIGEGPLFLYNGVSFAAVLAGLLMMRLEPFQPPPPQDRAAALRGGIAYIARDARVRLLMMQLALLCVFCLAYIPLLPAFARDVLHGNASTLGALASANAAGALVAALMIAVLGERLPRIKLRSVALLCYSLFLVGFTWSNSLALALVMIGAVGWCGITALTLSNTLLQIIVPDALRGRVMAVYVLMIMGVSQLAGLLVAGLADLAGDVALTVRVWTAVGWCLQLALFLSQRRVLQEPVRPQDAPAPTT
jgi:MFS family permease